MTIGLDGLESSSLGIRGAMLLGKYFLGHNPPEFPHTLPGPARPSPAQGEGCFIFAAAEIVKDSRR